MKMMSLPRALAVGTGRPCVVLEMEQKVESSRASEEKMVTPSKEIQKVDKVGYPKNEIRKGKDIVYNLHVLPKGPFLWFGPRSG